MALIGASELKRRLEIKRKRVELRYKYYEMKYGVKDLGISSPETLRAWGSVLGWCGKAVDSVADRLVVRGVDEDNDVYNFAELFSLNNPDVFFDSAILSALIASCCFVYISADETGFPRLQVIDGGNATGKKNDVNGFLEEGYAALHRDEYGQPDVEAYFLPGRTEIWTRGTKSPRIYETWGESPMLVPIVYRPDAMRPFGHSRISRAGMDIVQSALRTMKRSEISAEFYSFPQKYVLGTDPDAERLEKWKATISSLLEITSGEDAAGNRTDKPTVGQFQQQSMEPHLSQLRMFAGMFAGETGLTLDDMGFPSDNPSSSEAIRASHEQLRLTAAKAQRTFASGFRNVGYAAACLRDKTPYLRQQVVNERILWEPIFAPDASQLSGLGDAIIKIQKAFPEYFDEKKLRDLTGI